VSGADVDQDVVVTFTRTDIGNATQEQLDKLVIDSNEACAQYITVNSTTTNIGADKVTATVNITVAGNAPQSTCSITVSDPQGAFDPPLNCTATFTIFSQSQCSVTVEPTILPLKAGVLPKVRRIRIIGENSNFKLFQSKVTIEDIPIVIPLLVTQGIRINALILIPSTRTFTPGTKQVKVETGTETCFGTVVISE
jgi:hypothetical protein